MLNADDIEARIRSGLPGCLVRAVDMTGGGDHWQVLVVCDAFAGKPTLARHRMVYDLFQEELKGPLHALTLRTLTPDQAKEAP
jgi:stress-induced morphogen